MSAPDWKYSVVKDEMAIWNSDSTSAHRQTARGLRARHKAWTRPRSWEEETNTCGFLACSTKHRDIGER